MTDSGSGPSLKNQKFEYRQKFYDTEGSGWGVGPFGTNHLARDRGGPPRRAPLRLSDTDQPRGFRGLHHTTPALAA